MYNINASDFKLGIIYFIILFFILIICKNITKSSIEGFSADDITSIASKVGNIATSASNIPGKIIDIGNQIAGAATGITTVVNTKIGEAEARVNAGVQNIVNTAVQPITSTVGTVQRDLGTVTSSVNNMPNVMTGLVNTAVQPITATVGTVQRDLGTVTSAVNDMPNVITGLVNTAIQPITATVDTVQDELENIPTEIRSAISTVETKIMGQVNAIIDPIRGLIEEATGKIEWILGQIEGFPELINGFITIALDEFTRNVIDPISGLIDEAMGQISMVVRFITHLPEKIEKFAQNLGNLITSAIVDPFTALFGAFKNLFFQLYEILIKIGDKITSLPSCTALYMFQSVFGAIDGIYNYFVPAFLVSLISTIYAYTLQYPLSIISEMVGLDEWWDTCFNFNVNTQLDSIQTEFTKAGGEFTSKFGHMDFKGLIDFSDNPKQDEKLRAAKAKEDLRTQQEADSVKT
jgi:phage-related protein